MELTQAYDAICRMQRTFSAVDQAKLDMSWMVAPQQTVHSPEDPSHPPPGMMKVTRPKWDENAVFLFCWALSLAMGLTMLFLADRFGLMEGPAVLFICPLVYFAGLFIGYFLILMSREIVWIVLRFARRALPPPPASPDDPSPSDH